MWVFERNLFFARTITRVALWRNGNVKTTYSPVVQRKIYTYSIFFFEGD